MLYRSEIKVYLHRIYNRLHWFVREYIFNAHTVDKCKFNKLIKRMIGLMYKSIGFNVELYSVNK